jgi:hypothetical protein
MTLITNSHWDWYHHVYRSLYDAAHVCVIVYTILCTCKQIYISWYSGICTHVHARQYTIVWHYDSHWEWYHHVPFTLWRSTCTCTHVCQHYRYNIIYMKAYIYHMQWYMTHMYDIVLLCMEAMVILQSSIILSSVVNVVNVCLCISIVCDIKTIYIVNWIIIIIIIYIEIWLLPIGNRYISTVDTIVLCIAL